MEDQAGAAESGPLAETRSDIAADVGQLHSEDGSGGFRGRAKLFHTP